MTGQDRSGARKHTTRAPSALLPIPGADYVNRLSREASPILEPPESTSAKQVKWRANDQAPIKPERCSPA